MFAKDEIDALRPYCDSIASATEQEREYLLLRGLKLPAGVKPEKVDALLCPTPRDNYESRLFFQQKPEAHHPRNWNGQIRVLDSTWFAFSWQFATSGLRLRDILIRHLEGLIKP